MDELTASVRDSLVRLLIQLEQYADAIILLKRTVAAEEQVFGEQSLEVADTHKLFASVRLAQEKPAAAVKHLRRTVDIYTRVKGPDHPSTKKASALLTSLQAPDSGAKKPVFFVSSRRTKRSDTLGLA